MVSKVPGTSTPLKTGLAKIGTSRQEQASAVLSSILLLLGVMTTGMLLAWLSASIVWVRPSAPVKVADVGGGGFGDSRNGGENNLDLPSSEEVRQVVVEENRDQAFESMSSLVSTEVEALEAFDSVGRSSDSTGPGPSGPGISDGIPAWERWEIKFTAHDLDVYAKQLDFFKVELGVAGGGIAEVDYCSNFSAATPNRRLGESKNEKRLFFLNRAGNLREADRAFARKAGIEVSDRVVFQFYGPEMYKKLVTLEAERKGSRRIIDVKKTTFGIRGTAGQWEFYVIDQKYRAPLPYKRES